MDLIKTETIDRVLYVKLNRPELRNAFNPEMIKEITKVVSEASNDDELRALVLSGEGPAFCAGADLNYMKSMVDYSVAENRKDSEVLFDMFYALKTCDVPTIASLHGYVMGGALGLVSACDLAVAHKETQFCFSEVKLGIAPAVISPFIIRKTLPQFYNRYLLTAEMFSAKEAFKGGLISAVGNDSEKDEILKKWIKKFQQNGRRAVRATKTLVSYVEEQSKWLDQKSETTKVIADLRVSSEGQEGLRSFLEKRKPSWIIEREAKDAKN